MKPEHKGCSAPLSAESIPGVQRERIGHPTLREARLHGMIHHQRFRALHWDLENELWHVDHVAAQAHPLARITSGNLDNLLTVWESLAEGWLGDDFDGIG